MKKLILVEITFFKLLGVESNFAFFLKLMGVACSVHPHPRLLVYNLLLGLSIITTKLQPFSACGQSC
jgi:hypothetical protein